MMIKLKRHRLNPIIVPNKKVSWRSKAIFNCGAIKYKGKVMMLTRCIGEYTSYISRIGLAESEDGIHFKHSSKPVIKPSTNFDKWGCEDPRITKIGATFYITYVALSKPANKGGGPPRIALASTKDFKIYKKHGILSPVTADTRNGVLFPEKIKGKYVMLYRPFNWTKKHIIKLKGKIYVKVKERKVLWPKSIKLIKSFPDRPSIWVAYSNDLINWEGHNVLIEPKELWEKGKIGAGPPPIKTKKGWVLIYHGKDHGEDKEKRKYYVGSALLDLSSLKVIARTKKPLFEPKEKYEIHGHVKNVVFPTGTVFFGNQLFVYYGAADTFCCLATIEIDRLLSNLK